MRQIIIAVLALLVIPSVSQADDVYLRKGFVLKNCLVRDTTNNHITVETSERPRRYSLKIVELIIKKPYYRSRETEYYQNEERIFSQPPTLAQEPVQEKEIIKPSIPPIRYGTKRTYPNLYFLPISMVAVGLSIDYFLDATDLTDEIERFEEENQFLPLAQQTDVSPFKSTRTRKIIFGIVSLVGGVATFVFSLQSEVVQVQVSHNSIDMRIYL